jgi:hypothetical protein
VRDVTRVVRRPDGSQVSDDIPQTS